MNKSELTRKLAQRCDLPETKAAEVVNAIFGSETGEGIIATELDSGRKVAIAGFGTFETRHRSLRRGRNPATGEAIDIPPRKYPKFRPGRKLQQRIDGDPTLDY